MTKLPPCGRHGGQSTRPVNSGRPLTEDSSKTDPAGERASSLLRPRGLPHGGGGVGHSPPVLVLARVVPDR